MSALSIFLFSNNFKYHSRLKPPQLVGTPVFPVNFFTSVEFIENQILKINIVYQISLANFPYGISL